MKYLILSFLLAVNARADLKAFECKKALSVDKADQILSEVQTKYSGLKSFQARFIQYSFLAALETSELSSGIMSFEKPGKMRWVYEEPEAQEFTADGKSLWFYQPTDNQVLIDSFKTAFQSDLPVSFLMGIGDLRKNFSLKQGCSNQDGTLLSFLPKDRVKTDELSFFTLMVSSDSFLPIGAEITDVAGNKNSFLFNEMKPNVELASANFSPTFPKGTDVIDRRSESSNP
ncbi:MAG: outer membrane lipoprotein carrier protein LolA [Deltaproteobacteria bacterium]|nr:outer membrane lipoprotein carrier protein LolA [Deltaproteobacteria bacterium]